MPGKSANPVPKPFHTWQTPQNTEWNSRIQERRVLRERFMPSTDLALVGGFQTAAGWGSPDCSAAAQRLVSIPYLQVRMTAR